MVNIAQDADHMFALVPPCDSLIVLLGFLCGQNRSRIVVCGNELLRACNYVLVFCIDAIQARPGLCKAICGRHYCSAASANG